MSIKGWLKKGLISDLENRLQEIEAERQEILARLALLRGKVNV